MPLEILLAEMRRLANLGTEESLKEARLVAAMAAPFCHPKLQAVMSQTEITTNYVARLPTPVKDIAEWLKLTPLLLKH